MRSRTHLSLSKDERDAFISELSQGISKAFENALELYQEATLLRSHGAFSRALFLHQVSMEECGKIEILGAGVTSLLAGRDIDVKKTVGATSRHKSKNYAIAYFLSPTEEEREARDLGDWKRALAAFTQRQTTFHVRSNTAKNASLYVDFSDTRFVSPKERVSQEMVAEWAERNRELLALSEPKVCMLARWLADTAEASRMIALTFKRMEELKVDPEMDPRKAMVILMDEMLAQARATDYHQIGRGEFSSSIRRKPNRASKKRRGVTEQT
jgi:AbiV family abortive infection protein